MCLQASGSMGVRGDGRLGLREVYWFRGVFGAIEPGWSDSGSERYWPFPARPKFALREQPASKAKVFVFRWTVMVCVQSVLMPVLVVCCSLLRYGQRLLLVSFLLMLLSLL